MWVAAPLPPLARGEDFDDFDDFEDFEDFDAAFGFVTAFAFDPDAEAFAFGFALDAAGAPSVRNAIKRTAAKLATAADPRRRERSVSDTARRLAECDGSLKT